MPAPIKDLARAPEIVPSIFIFFNFFLFFRFFFDFFDFFFARTVYITIQCDRVYIYIIYIYIFGPWQGPSASFYFLSVFFFFFFFARDYI